MNKLAKNLGVYLAIFLIVLAMAWFFQNNAEPEIKEITFTQMTTFLMEERISDMTIEDRVMSGTLKNGDKFVCYAPSILSIENLNNRYIIPQMESKKITVKGEKPKTPSLLASILPTLLIIAVFIVFWMMFMNQGQGGGKVMSFGKSRARLHKEEDLKKVTFKEVAGLDEEKEELTEVVDFLKNPRKYRDLGARIPKGILLVGPPGTGKTYLSKAAAGEAGVPFYSISGSDFVEMFVGVGASRVRDLFEQAKKNSPCIIFIDEIDAVGRKRGAGLGGGHDEREQTLNQLLVEMDGFGENSGIIILAATNRPDILDSALLRPGRFDRQVIIGIPDIKGREAIFEVHSRNKPLDESVNPKVLARRTPGFTPADIENLLNEAALLTARRNGRKIRMTEVEEAITKVIAGPEKKSRVISENERKLTAYHEAGHAIVAHALPNTDPVHQITIIPRGRAGGFTMILPKEDKYYSTKTIMEEQIIHLLGGRVAEKLTLDDISTGASNDIERATEIARAMVTKYGMSERVGPVNYSSSDEVFLGKDFSTRKNFSEEMASEIDEEIRNIIESAFGKAEKILQDNIEILHKVAKGLLELETLDGDQFEALYSGAKTVEELQDDMLTAEEAIKEANAREAAELEQILASEKEDEEDDEFEESEEGEEGEEGIISIEKNTLEKEASGTDGDIEEAEVDEEEGSVDESDIEEEETEEEEPSAIEKKSENMMKKNEEKGEN